MYQTRTHLGCMKGPRRGEGGGLDRGEEEGRGGAAYRAGSGLNGGSHGGVRVGYEARVGRR